MKRFSLTLSLLLLSLLLVAGCGKSNPGPTETPSQASSSASGGGGTGQPTPGKKSAASSPTQSSEEDALSLSSRDEGLDKLKSYRITWKSEWKTTKADKTETAAWDWTEEYSSSPEALHWIWKYDDASSNAGSMEAWQIGATTYMLTTDKSGTGNCISISSQDASNRLEKGMFSPNALGSLSGARFVGNENVNGVAARHYRYDERTAAIAAFAKLSGDIWVAADGGYVVRDQLKWQGSAGLFGTGAGDAGEGQWDWELSNANGPVTITAPDNCGGEAADLPMLPDAADKTTIGNLTTYKTKTSIEATIAFYKKALLDAGWKLDGEPQSVEGYATMSFSKQAKKAQVNLTSDSGETTVMINVTTE